MVIKDVLRQYRAEVEEEMRAVFAGRSLPLYALQRYHLGWADAQGRPVQADAGKRLRPIFCLLAAEAVGGSRATVLPAAAALELVHNFSLVHDDIQDVSDERHHRPTVWKLWGAAQAINVGDSMFVLARLALLKLADRGLAPAQVLHAVRVLDEACLRLCEGQYLDMAFQDRLDVGVADYLEMIAGKTAALLGASLELGAWLGSGDLELAAGYRQFGQALGLAFQIKDDVLGVWGAPAVTGKPAADDIRERKKSLPIVYALERAQGEDLANLRRIYRQPALSPSDVTAVLALLDGLGARGYAQALAEEHSAAALAALAQLPSGRPAYESLQELAAFVVQREY